MELPPVRRNARSLSMVLAILTFAAPLRGQSLDEIRDAIEGLSWRSIGPAEMGGRTVDIAGIPGDPSTVYMATASGGLWKTNDGGTTWRSIFETGNTLSLGAVTVAPSDHNVIYIGTGENNPRNSASIGDGVYRSTDAGESWTHLGLEDTEKIGRIRIHPRNPDIVYVAALGHAWGANQERGVFRSLDGGKQWQKVLYVNEDTGAADLALDPGNPRILYAGMWDFRRRAFHFRSGGPGSGLYRSQDGGDTWTNLSADELENGLPGAPLGRIGVATSAADPRVVYAFIESQEDGVLWGSDDRGRNWRVVTKAGVNTRPFYYSDIRADPNNVNRVYALSGRLSVSEDGGRTWEQIAHNIHGDHQSLWIDPEDSTRLINGNDGGFHFSFDRGVTWQFINNVPLGQFYQIGVDMRDPYYVCGGLQDNDAWCGPSRTLNVTGPLKNYWHEIIGPGDGMYVQIDPTDHNIIYTNSQAGNIFRVDLGRQESRSIHPYPVAFGGSAAGDHPLRFNWNSPIHMSPHDPTTIYFGGNVLFKTIDGGQTWQKISPDLTTNDPEKVGLSGGPITPDNSGAEYHSTIYTIAESPLQQGVIWAGTDDGNVQLTRDGGTNWINLTDNFMDLPAESWVSRIEASGVDGGTAYIAFDRHRSNDMSPYLFKTTDYGDSWTSIADNLPSRNYIHVVREDPRNPNLIYVGTELGIYASWSGGGDWVSLRLGLPTVAVRDLVVHPRDNDLIIGTHGRSIWILDDIGPLQQLGQALQTDSFLFSTRTARRYEPWAARFRADVGDNPFVADNPPYGAVVSYFIAKDSTILEQGSTESEAGGAGALSGDEPATEASPDAVDAAGEGSKDRDPITLTIRDGDGQLVRRLEGPREAGIHRVAWDLRADPLPDLEDDSVFAYELTPPRVLPGDYSIVWSLPGRELTTSLELLLDARTRVPSDDLKAQRDALLALWEIGGQAIQAIRTIDALDSQLDALTERLEQMETPPGQILDSTEQLVVGLAELRAKLADDDLATLNAAIDAASIPHIMAPR